MAETIEPISGIGSEWINVNAEIGVDVGTPLILQNTGATTLILAVKSVMPDADSQAGRFLYPLKHIPLNGENSTLWVKSINKTGGISRLQADLWGGIDFTGQDGPGQINNLTYEGDNLTYEGDQLTYGD